MISTFSWFAAGGSRTDGARPQDGDALAGPHSRAAAGVHAYAERLAHGTLLVADVVWQPVAEVRRVVHVLHTPSGGSMTACPARGGKRCKQRAATDAATHRRQLALAPAASTDSWTCNKVRHISNPHCGKHIQEIGCLPMHRGGRSFTSAREPCTGGVAKNLMSGSRL